MLVRSVAALAALGLAVAEPMPYKPSMMKTSARSLFGVVRRQESGYQPSQSYCGQGATCAEACGAGYTTCASSDSQIHCFNPDAGELCCPDGSGNSCDKGYFCTADVRGDTWCCPDGMDLVACAAAYSVTGGLVSQTPKATSTSVSSTSTSAAPSTTAEPSTSTEAEEEESTTVGPSSIPSVAPTSSFVQPNGTATTISTGKPPAPTSTGLAEGAASVAGPAGALALFAAGLAAVLL